jgi:hypothetical protein
VDVCGAAVIHASVEGEILTQRLAPSGRSGAVCVLHKVVLARYTAQGALDKSFGTNGVATVDLPGTSLRAAQLAIQSDGRIVVALRSEASAGVVDATVVRLWD